MLRNKYVVGKHVLHFPSLIDCLFQYQLNNHLDENHLKISSLAHVDHDNVHTFEIKDLQKLILKVSEDLSAADKARREEFKVRNNFIAIKVMSTALLSSNTSSRKSLRSKKS